MRQAVKDSSDLAGAGLAAALEPWVVNAVLERRKKARERAGDSSRGGILLHSFFKNGGQPLTLMHSHLDRQGRRDLKERSERVDDDRDRENREDDAGSDEDSGPKRRKRRAVAQADSFSLMSCINFIQSGRIPIGHLRLLFRELDAVRNFAAAAYYCLSRLFSRPVCFAGRPVDRFGKA